MRTFLIVIFIFFYFNEANGQQDVRLPGVAVEQNSKFNTGKINYLSNVEVKSPGAIPQLSDAKGKFTLVFADKPFGNVARVYVSKNNYEVVNEEELKKAAVLGRLLPLKVVLCQAGQLYENQVAYYRIARDAALETYRRRAAILEKEGREKDLLIAEMRVEFNREIKTAADAYELLQQQLEGIEKQARELADKFVTINLDDQSATYQRAYLAFMDKDIARALSILDSVDLEHRLATNTVENRKDSAQIKEREANIARRNEQIQQDVNQCVFKARLHILEYEFDKAEQMFELGLQYAGEDEELIAEFAIFLQEQNKFEKAEAYLKKNLKIRRKLAKEDPATYLSKLSKTLNNIGALYEEKNEVAEAKLYFEEALGIRRELAQKNSDAYLPDVALTLNNIGILLMHNNELGETETYFGESLEIIRGLMQKNADAHLPDLALVLSNYGLLLEKNNEFAKARNCDEEALQIRRTLAEKKPNAYLPDVADNLNHIGILLMKNNKLMEAKTYYEEALAIRRSFSAKNPDVYLPDEARLLSNLGALFYSNNEITQAIAYYEEALEIVRGLTRKNPDVYLQDVANTLSNLGVALLRDNNESAKACMEEALEIRETLAKTNPNVFLPDVAATLNNLGALSMRNQNLTQARSYYIKALKIRRALADKNPDAYLPDVSATLNNLGVLLLEIKDMARAETYHEEALKIRKTLAERNPNAYLPNVAASLNNLGNVFVESNQLLKARACYEEALEIKREYADKSPGAYNLDVSMTSINLGFLYEKLLIKTKDTLLKNSAIALIKDAQKRLSIYPSEHPIIQEYLDYINDIHSFFTKLDDEKLQLYQKIARLKEEIEAELNYHQRVARQQKAIDILYQIARDIPDNSILENELAIEYGSLAEYQLFDRQFAAAEAAAQKGLELDDSEAWINTSLGLALLYQGKFEEAKRKYLFLKEKPYKEATYGQVFLDELGKLEEAGIRHPDAERIRAVEQ